MVMELTKKSLKYYCIHSGLYNPDPIGGVQFGASEGWLDSETAAAKRSNSILSKK